MSGAGKLGALGLALGGGLVAWWVFGGDARPPRATGRAGGPVNDDLELVTALLDGAAAEPPRDVLVAGADEVYLARSGDRTVSAVKKSDGAARELATLEGPARGMALCAGALWVTTRHELDRIPVDGTAPRVVATNLERPGAVACDGRWVFAVDGEPGGAGLTRGGAVARVAMETGERVVLGRSEGAIGGLAVDAEVGAGRVYWTAPLEGAVMAAPKGGGEATVLAAERGLPGAIAASADAVVWLEQRSESLWEVGQGGGAPRQLAQDFAGFANLVVDGRGVFWSNEAAVDGAFRVLTAKAGEAIAVSGAVESVDALASDGVALWWSRAGKVSRVAPP